MLNLSDRKLVQAIAENPYLQLFTIISRYWNCTAKQEIIHKPDYSRRVPWNKGRKTGVIPWNKGMHKGKEKKDDNDDVAV